MTGGTSTKLPCVSASLRENIRGDSRHSRGNVLSSSFGEDVVEGAGVECIRIWWSVSRPAKGEIYSVRIVTNWISGIVKKQS